MALIIIISPVYSWFLVFETRRSNTVPTWLKPQTPRTVSPSVDPGCAGDRKGAHVRADLDKWEVGSSYNRSGIFMAERVYPAFPDVVMAG